MKFRLIELIFVVGIVGVVAAYLRDKPASTQVDGGGKNPGPIVAAGSPSPALTPLKTLSIGEAVPAFALSDPAGQAMSYAGAKGPVLIVLTATGCGGCLERIDGVDRKAYELAQSLKVPVWNLLVYQGINGAPGFVSQRNPSADLVLCDPTSDISVKTLGGSDATCWLLIDGEGKLAWRGPAEIDGLKEALKGL